MKVFFFIVCLLNVVFFSWEFHKGALNPPLQTKTTLPAILLAGEVESARRDAVISAHLDKDSRKEPLLLEEPAEKPVENQPQAKPKEAAVKIQPVACYEAGPFPDQRAAAAWLTGQSVRGELFHKEVLIPSAYLVYYPSDKDPEHMRISRMMLNAKGINDIWVVPSGELKGALSLGVFNDQSRAVSFKNQLSQRGVQAEIKERYKSQSQLFARIRTDRKMPPKIAGVTPVAVSCAER